MTSATDANRVVLTGENPFIRLSPTDGEDNTTDASFWRIIFSPAGPGHVLYINSELTDNAWRIYSDNIAMARWLQSTVQGMLNAATADHSIPVIEASFDKHGDMRDFWTETVLTADEEIALTWYGAGDPLLVHTEPSPERRYGVCTILVPVTGARLTLNGAQASGQPWPRERDGRPFSTCALAFSESWTETRET
jgi:hypothetical protein